MVTRDVWTTQAERDAKLLLQSGHRPDKIEGMKLSEEIWLVPFSRQWTVLRRLYLIPALICAGWVLLAFAFLWWNL